MNPIRKKNGAYTGGLITTPAPGGVSAVIISEIPVITSGIAKIRAGSGFQPSRLAAKPANASPSRPMCPYPASLAAIAVATASMTGPARSKSISATNDGSTSSG